ncbi:MULTISPECIES: MrcB family domain-containing protein [Actinomycetes]|uniref:MrcB family domain-containing protein n=1 Tax=Actinomycetes TaxID=1760 RepID=UPI0018DD9326|nr:MULTISPECIES: DUF3578 domain-containing protein [Actinomycetes]
MDDLLSKVLDLQGVWTAVNTDEMKKRGVFVRQELPAFLRGYKAELADALGVAVDELGVEGRDGTGLKTEIPWVRVYGVDQSPSATSGWYVVYLFGATGERVYLSLMQGTTVWTGGDFKQRKVEDLRARASWARPVIAEQVTTRSDLKRDLRLEATTTLGRGYGPGTVVAFEYSRETLPGQEVLLADLRYMLGLLRRLYEAERLAPHIPGDPAPEILEAEQSAAKAAGRRTRKGSRRLKPGQGYRLSAEERDAIERHSVDMATEFFQAQGWTVKDVGARESYDLLLTRVGRKMRAEVKGTASAGLDVILTRAEVQKQRQYYPDNALVVVHSITLERTGKKPVASGGTLHCTSPWSVEEDDLTVISYSYRTQVGTTPSSPGVPQQRQSQGDSQVTATRRSPL